MFRRQRETEIELVERYREYNASIELEPRNADILGAVENAVDDDFASDESINSWKTIIENYKLGCTELKDEMMALEDHLNHIEANMPIAKEIKSLYSNLLDHVYSFEQKYLKNDYSRYEKSEVLKELKLYCNLIKSFHSALYGPRHAFYFRYVKKWEKHVKEGTTISNEPDIETAENTELHPVFRDRFMTRKEAIEAFIPTLVPIMKEVVHELQSFSKTAVPSLLTNEEEEAKALYDASMTTIATFFSSVTATTLQFSYSSPTAPDSAILRGAVNLFWFLSLVFSVASGVNSLMGMAWRKSNVLKTSKAPKLLKIWLDNSPMACLIISALMFVVGLNIFVYFSVQPLYVSLSTNCVTGVHVICLFAVALWFLFCKKRNSKWVRTITSLSLWVTEPGAQYKRYKLHWKRNIFWAFKRHEKVADANISLHKSRDWPRPWLLARAVHTVMDLFEKRNARAKRTSDSLNGMQERELDSYFEQLEEIFVYRHRGPSLPRLIKETIDAWLDDSWEGKFIGNPTVDTIVSRLLWGYPELSLVFKEHYFPSLHDIRERRKTEKLKEERFERMQREREHRKEAPPEDRQQEGSHAERPLLDDSDKHGKGKNIYMDKSTQVNMMNPLLGCMCYRAGFVEGHFNQHYER